MSDFMALYNCYKVLKRQDWINFYFRWRIWSTDCFFILCATLKSWALKQEKRQIPYF